MNSQIQSMTQPAKQELFQLTNQVTLENVQDICIQIAELCHSSINYIWLGQQSYGPVWELQKKLHRMRVDKEVEDVVLLLEHNHVYTLGKNADQNHLLPTYPKDADVVQIDRGGDITYHGPGQLVGYPIVDLHQYEMSISWYMRSLEEVIIQLLAEFDLSSLRKDGLTGVWIEDEKICAMGVRLSRWVTMHGFAFNINPDMNYFDGMIPCGIFEFGVTDLKSHVTDCPDILSIANLFSKHLQNIFMSKRSQNEISS